MPKARRKSAKAAAEIAERDRKTDRAFSHQDRVVEIAAEIAMTEFDGNPTDEQRTRILQRAGCRAASERLNDTMESLRARTARSRPSEH